MLNFEKLCCTVIGYFFGCLLFGQIVARSRKHDLFEEGSGNPGMANAGRVMGTKAAALVLIGDICKTLAACLLCYYLFSGLGKISFLYTGLGVMLGHDFPFWHKFQGGKGVAVCCTTIILYNPLAGILSCLIGFLFVLLKQGLKIPAVIIPGIFAIWMMTTQNAQAICLSLMLVVLMAERNLRKTKLDLPKTGKKKKKAASH